MFNALSESERVLLTELAGQPKPLAMFQVRAPGDRALDLLKHVRTECYDWRIMLAADSVPPADAATALKLGAHGIVLIPSPPSDLRACLATILRGDTWVARPVLKDALNHALERTRLEQRSRFGTGRACALKSQAHSEPS
jgi:DNA-binding NarL/FixJ family response regulator